MMLFDDDADFDDDFDDFDDDFDDFDDDDDRFSLLRRKKLGQAQYHSRSGRIV